jgi:RimJ/RimL family protein N-acetyltransferase
VTDLPESIGTASDGHGLGTQPYFLTTDRLNFRRWDPSDHALVGEFFSDPNITAPLGGPFSPAKAHAWLAEEIANGSQAGVQYWPIFRQDNGEHVGCCGLLPIEEGKFQIGYYVRATQQGQGFATEAAKAVVRFAFESLGASELAAGHQPGNIASGSVLIKAGLERLPTDENHYRMTRADFDQISWQ